MKVCSNCGHLLDESAKFCDECGTAVVNSVYENITETTAETASQPQPQQTAPQEGTYYVPPAQNEYVNTNNNVQYQPPQYSSYQYTGAPVQPENESGSTLLAIFSFFVPIVGLILYIVYKKDKPKTAKKCGKAALISVILSVILSIIMFVVLAVVGMQAENNDYDEDVSGLEDRLNDDELDNFFDEYDLDDFDEYEDDTNDAYDDFNDFGELDESENNG